MKTFLFLVLLSLVAVAKASPGYEINASNYHLSSVLRAHETYTGVVVDTQDVSVYATRGGIVGGLTFGITNALTGSHVGQKRYVAYQYVIRLDALRGRQARLITVIQGGPRRIEPGTPCFLMTEDCDLQLQFFSVRVIESQSPDAYDTEGLEERRIRRNEEARQREYDEARRRQSESRR